MYSTKTKQSPPSEMTHGYERKAYMMYVTDPSRLCPTIIMTKRLMHLNIHPSIDIVVLSTLPETQVKKRFDLNVKIIQVSPWEQKRGERTWRKSLTKLHVFKEYGYDRIIYLDSDAWLMKNIDHLFHLPKSIFWAPRAYWIQQPFIQSTLLVVEPNDEIYNTLRTTVEYDTRTLFDMDVLNILYKNECGILPSSYVVLNGDLTHHKPFLFDTFEELKNNTFIWHFSTTSDLKYGKPWTHRSLPSGNETDPFFYQLFELYFDAERNTCGAAP